MGWYAPLRCPFLSLPPFIPQHFSIRLARKVQIFNAAFREGARVPVGVRVGGVWGKVALVVLGDRGGLVVEVGTFLSVPFPLPFRFRILPVPFAVPEKVFILGF